MPSFMKKLFRRSKADSNSGDDAKKPKKLSKKERKAAAKKKEDGSFNVNIGKPSKQAQVETHPAAEALSPVKGGHNQQQPLEARRPSLNTASLSSGREPSREKYEAKGGSSRGGLSADAALSPRHHAASPNGALSPSKRSPGPIDLDEDGADGGVSDDDSEAERENRDPRGGGNVAAKRGGAPSPKLSHQQLLEFDMQHAGNSYQHPHNPYAPPDEFRKPQLSRLSNGQLVEMDGPPGAKPPGAPNKNNPGSPTYSSDFCLSTDNEDPEYNDMRRKARGLPPGPGSQPFPNALDSPSSYGTEEEDRELGIFPALLNPHQPHGQGQQQQGGVSATSLGDGLMDMMDSTALSPRHKAAAAQDPVPEPQSPPSKRVSGSPGDESPASGNKENVAGQACPVSPRFTFEGEEDDFAKMAAAKSPRSVGSGADRPPSPVPGFPGIKQPQLGDQDAAANATPSSPDGGAALSPRAVAIQQARRAGAIATPELYPDSTDSEFEPNKAEKRGAKNNADPLLPPQATNVASPTAAAPQDPPQKSSKKPANDSFADFGNFGDFANFDDTAFPAQRKDAAPPASALSPKEQGFIVPDGGVEDCATASLSKSPDPFFVDTAHAEQVSPRLAIEDVEQDRGPSVSSSAKPAPAPAVSPLSDLLSSQAEASSHSHNHHHSSKGASHRRSSRRSQRDREAGSSSVNSAPVITAEFLRKTHNLGSGNQNSSSSKSVTAPSDPILTGFLSTERSSGRGRSSRQTSPKEGEVARSEAKSGASAASGAAAAKDKLRQRRRDRERGDDDGDRSPTRRSKSSTSRHRRHRSHGSRRSEREARGDRESRDKDANKDKDSDDDDNSDNGEAESWLFDEVTGALGPRGIAADLESLSGRSARSKNSTGNKSHRSHRSHKSHRSTKSRSRSHRHREKKSSDVDSVGSRNSRASRYSHRSTKSHLSHMSEQSRSVANDLLRLEMQLAMVGKEGKSSDGGGGGGGGSVSGDKSVGSVGARSRTSRRTQSSSSHSVAKRMKVTVVAPPGKLGIILANKTDAKGTVVSGVRTSSVLADRVNPGDRIVAIDGEDVSRMTVSEITTIMARKSEFERVLTVLTTLKREQQGQGQGQHVSSSSGGGGEGHQHGHEGDHGSVSGTSISSYSNYANSRR